MTPAATTLHQLITAERHHLIRPDALLEDLLGCHMAEGLAINIETALGLAEFPERVVAGWLTVADVEASVTRAMALRELSDLGQEMERG